MLAYREQLVVYSKELKCYQDRISGIEFEYNTKLEQAQARFADVIEDYKARLREREKVLQMYQKLLL